MIARTLFRLARHDVTDPVVRWGLVHLSRFLPVRRVANTRWVLGFHHPKPGWTTHILLVPKVSIPSLVAVDETNRRAVREILTMAQSLARSTLKDEAPRALIVNGGAYQEVGQMHFHLIAGAGTPTYDCPRTMSPASPIEEGTFAAFLNPTPANGTHFVLRLADGVPSLSGSDQITDAHVHALIAVTRMLVRRHDLADSGFSLVCCDIDGRLDYSCFHLLSGKSIRAFV